MERRRRRDREKRGDSAATARLDSAWRRWEELKESELVKYWARVSRVSAGIASMDLF